jgi:hypothetical protein
LESLVHIIIPVIFLLSLRINRKIVFFLSPLTILPDFDFLLGKRVVFHSLLFAILLCLGLFLIAKHNKRFSKYATTVFFVSLFFLGSHLLLDLWGVGIGLLYPFSDRLYGIKLNLGFILPSLELYSDTYFFANSPSAAVTYQKMPVLTEIG